MSKHIQLTIEDPCLENWNKMTKAEQGRFCASCQKQVIDFTGMTDSQIAVFFKKPLTGSVCGRFFNDQLERDIEIPKKRIPWVKYFFQFALPAFLLSMKATAQGNVRLSKRKAVSSSEVVVSSSSKLPINQNPMKIPFTTSTPPQTPQSLIGRMTVAVKSTPQLNAKDSGLIKGRVITENGEPVCWATIMIKGTKIGTIANANGEFSIDPGNECKNAVLVGSCVGFVTTELKIENDGSHSNMLLPFTMQYMVAGELIVKKTSKKKEPKSIPLLTQKLMDSAFKFFKIFPNPVSPGASLHIEWKQIEEGYYILDLLDLSGKKIYSKEVWMDIEARVLNLEIPSVSAGNYLLRVSNKQTGKNFTEKIVIQ